MTGCPQLASVGASVCTSADPRARPDADHLSRQSLRTAPAVRAGGRPARGHRQAGRGHQDGLSFQTLLGVTGSGKTFTMANVIARTGRPALVMAPNKTLAAQLYSEFREFFPNNAVEYFVSYYDYYQPEAYVPSRDLFIEKDSSINEHIEQMRLSATKALLERHDCVIVATVSAIYGIGDPVDYHSMILHLRAGRQGVAARRHQAPDRDAVRRATTSNSSAASFRVRGDVIDIFPAENAENAMRVSLFDDEVESLYAVRPAHRHILQQKLAALHRVPVQPLRHAARHQVAARDRADQGRAGASRWSTSSAQMKLVEAQRIEQRTRFDLEMMNEIGFCKGIENYSRHLSGPQAGRAAADADRLPARAMR